MISDVLVLLLYLCSGGDEGDDELQTVLKLGSVGDLEENEVLRALRETKAKKQLVVE